MKIFFILIIFISNSIYAGMSVKDYQEFKKDKNSLEWYLLGLGNGFGFSNTELQTRNITSIYCPPPDLKLTKEMLQRMLEKRIKEISNKPGYENLQIEPMLLSKLTELYPCTSKIKS